MTSAITSQPRTAAALLFGEGRDSSAALAHALVEQGVVGSLGSAVKNLSRAGRAAIGGQLASVAHGLIDLDLDDIIIGGWRKYADIMQAAKRTVSQPGSREVVGLATHNISFTHQPYVELIVNEVPVATVHFELSLKFTVKGLVAAIRDGHLVSLHSGDCEVVGTLAAEGRQLARRSARVQLPLLLRLGDGIRLIRTDEAQGSEQPEAEQPSAEQPEAQQPMPNTPWHNSQ